MAKYVVRCNCEYSLEVEAPTPEEALAKAEAIDVADWDQAAWSESECDEAEATDEPDALAVPVCGAR